MHSTISYGRSLVIIYFIGADLVKILSSLEEWFLKFIFRRAGRLSEVINREIEKEIIEYHEQWLKKLGDMGIDIENKKLLESIESSRAYRTENIKFAAPNVISLLAFVLSIFAFVISVIALFK